MAKAVQYSFMRYEQKFILTEAQYGNLREALSGFMAEDEYGRHTICNVYYDTEDFRLVRASIEKPVYKEKLRLRSYGVPARGDTVFVELKKKFGGIVYKRRVSMGLQEAEAYLAGRRRPGGDSQILREIDWVLGFYGDLYPRAFVAYDRVALFGLDDEALRLTFDKNIRCRDKELSLARGDRGGLILPADRVLMEIKIPGTTPVWLSRLLSEQGIFSTSFSKYGNWYKDRPANGAPCSTARNGVIHCA